MQRHRVKQGCAGHGFIALRVTRRQTPFIPPKEMHLSPRNAATKWFTSQSFIGAARGVAAGQQHDKATVIGHRRLRLLGKQLGRCPAERFFVGKPAEHAHSAVVGCSQLCRCRATISSADSGPQLPAAYSEKSVAGTDSQASRIGVTTCQAHSI